MSSVPSGVQAMRAQRADEHVGLTSPLGIAQTQLSAQHRHHWSQGGVAQLGEAAEPLDLPLDRPRLLSRDHAGGRVDFLLPDGAAAALRRIADAERTTMSVVLLAAFLALLRRHGSQEDLRVGVPMTGRNRVETEDIVGLFVNTLPLRLAVGPELSLRALLQQDMRENAPLEASVQQLRGVVAGT